MDIFLEQFNLDPTREYYESIRYFEESYKYDNELIDMVNEATTGVTKKNIIQKFFDFIKKIIAWIVKAIKALITKIKTFFTGKKQSAEQALQDAGIEPSKTSEDSSQSTVVKIVTTDSEGQESSVDYNVPAKDLFVKIDNDVNRLQFVWRGPTTKPIADAKYNNPQFDKDINIKSGAGNGSAYHRFVYFYQKRDELEKLLGVIEKLITIKDLSDDEVNSVCNSASELKSNVKRISVSTVFEIDMKSLEEYNELFMDLNNKLSKVNMDDFSTDNLRVMEAYKFVCNTLTIMQFGFNNITNAIYRIYDVDAQYIGTCKDAKVLDTAVYALIKAGIPHNHVARNTYLLADEKLRRSSDINDPARGQSRMVLLPEDESIVYKIALNPLGISDNNRENQTYNIALKGGFSNCFAASKELYTNKCIQTMERVSTKWTDNHKNNFSRDKVRLNDNLNIMKDKIGLVINDLHDGNFGYVNKDGNERLVVIDYGQAFRSSSSR